LGRAGTRDCGWVTQAATAPFRFFQRRFDPGRGPGLFALGARIKQAAAPEAATRR
jgi:hypothetical protein